MSLPIGDYDDFDDDLIDQLTVDKKKKDKKDKTKKKDKSDKKDYQDEQKSKRNSDEPKASTISVLPDLKSLQATVTADFLATTVEIDSTSVDVAEEFARKGGAHVVNAFDDRFQDLQRLKLAAQTAEAEQEKMQAHWRDKQTQKDISTTLKQKRALEKEQMKIISGETSLSNPTEGQSSNFSPDFPTQGNPAGNKKKRR